LTIRDSTFPGWCGVTFVDELPLLRLMAHARGIDPQGQRANMKDAVAHLSQRFAEPRSLGTIAALAKRNRPAQFADRCRDLVDLRLAVRPSDKTDETTGEKGFVSFVSSPCGRFRIFSALSSFPAISVRTDDNHRPMG
jgi:hypothetical protein